MKIGVNVDVFEDHEKIRTLLSMGAMYIRIGKHSNVNITGIKITRYQALFFFS